MRLMRTLNLRQYSASHIHTARQARCLSRFCVLLVASLLSTVANAAAALESTTAINIHLIKANDNIQTLSLPATSRLSDAINHLHINDGDYWPALTWLRQGVREQYRQKHAELISLIYQQIEQQPNKQKQWAQLEQQVLHMQVSDRMVIALHPDRIYAKASENFLLQDEDSLILPARPKTITITGFVERQQLPHLPQNDVLDYLEQVSHFELADNSEVWLIHPDTRAELIPIAYWNKHDTRRIAPGSIIFVPAREQLFSKQYQKVNQLYLELLQNQYIGYRQGEKSE